MCACVCDESAGAFEKKGAWRGRHELPWIGAGNEERKGEGEQGEILLHILLLVGTSRPRTLDHSPFLISLAVPW